MNNKIKILIKDITIILAFLILSKFIEIDLLGFCLGATYIILFDLGDKLIEK